MAFELAPHQVEDAQFLAARAFAGCFNDMGSGKTRTDLEAARLVSNCDSRHLLVAPPIALPMWRGEAEDHLGVEALIAKTGKMKLLDSADYIIMSYAIAVARVEELKRIQWKTCTFDEGHACKNPAAKRTKALLGARGLWQAADHVWDLTGTPITRWADDIYMFLLRAAPDRLREACGGTSLQKFKLKFCIVQKRTFPGARWPVEMVVGNRNLELLNQLLFEDDYLFKGDPAPAVRRQIEEVHADMPDLTETTYQIKLDVDAEGRKLLKEASGFSLGEVQSMQAKKDPALATIMRTLGLGKVKAAVSEIAERVDAGQKPILVGAWHTDVVTTMSEALNDIGIKTAFIYGKTKSAQDVQTEADFNDGLLDVLVGNIQSMGVSLNLQKGGHRIMTVEKAWSPSDMKQFYARLRRWGQTHHVHVDHLEGGHPIEGAQNRILGSKQRTHTTVMGDKL